MNPTLRPALPADGRPCAVICYEAFKNIAERHGFPPELPSAEVGLAILSRMLGHPGFHGVVAEVDGRIVGSNFVDERAPIAGIGPITVDPAVQNLSIGRRLMEYVLARADERRMPGIRLVQSGYHCRSLTLYARLGFAVREPLAIMQGAPLRLTIGGHAVRPATDADLDECSRLCTRVHGHDRAGEVRDAIADGAATVVEHDGRITGYATGIAFFGHAVGETTTDLQALIGAAPAFPGPGFHVPTRNAALFEWCLAHGLRMVQPMTLMSRGLYNEPAGAFLPSILY